MNNFLSSIVAWLRAGYPEGIPPTDYFPVLALLTRRLSNDEVKLVAREVMQQFRAMLFVKADNCAIRQL